MSLEPFFITGYSAGLQTNKKPFLLPDRAWQKMENAYTWRERVKKREGNKFLGRLRRALTGQSLGNTAAGPPNTVTITNIFSTLSLEATGELQPGSVDITVAAPDSATFSDNGDGTFSVTGSGVSAGSYVDYVTGKIVLKFTSLTGGAAITAALSYFPGLPVMGIIQREIALLNDEQTIWFDTVYAYIFGGMNFQEFIPGTTWNASNSDFFWGFNYRGINPGDRLLFVTDFVCASANPMRYTDGATWTNFAPLVSATTTLFQARILIAYYGRLIALNVFEGTTAGGYGGASQIANRCRFSQYNASPVDVNAWRSDIFGKGGFIDAPTSEEITGATFVKNTLVVDFERTTWQLRYLGEYGTPFIWERISSDFGGESTFSPVLFDNHRLTIGDKGITASSAVNVDRIDLDIPDQIFDFKNSNNGPQRVFGIRDFQKELVYWNYPDAQTQAAPGVATVFPNKVLVFNYRNNTWAVFRDNITAFGTYQSSTNITWDNTDIFWDDEDISWDDFDTQSLFPFITSGNQEGFVHIYGYVTPDEESLSITAIASVTGVVQLTVINHNLADGESIYITGMMFISSSTFLPVTTSLNNTIYQVTVIDINTISIALWSDTLQEYATDFSYTPVLASSIYVGGGSIALFPKLNIVSKDINLYQSKSLQTKLSRIDFLMGATQTAAMTINLFLNSSPAVQGNLLVGNTNMSTALTSGFYPPASDYAWFRFYATLAAQYFSINITYNDSLMNQISTHNQNWILYAINAMCRAGGKNCF